MRSILRSLTVISVAAALITLAPGCDVGCVTGRDDIEPTCSASGSVTVSGAALATSGVPEVGSGQSCLAPDGSCSDRRWFSIATTYAPSASGTTGPDDFSLTVSLPPGEGPTPYTLPLPSVLLSFAPAPGSRIQPTLVAGTIAVQTSTVDHLVATFEIMVHDQATGRTFTLAGTANVGSCHEVEMCTF